MAKKRTATSSYERRNAKTGKTETVSASAQRREVGQAAPRRRPSPATNRALVGVGATSVAVGGFRALDQVLNVGIAVGIVTTLFVLVVGGVMSKRQGRAWARRTFLAATKRPAAGRVAERRASGPSSDSPAAQSARFDGRRRLEESRAARRLDAKHRRRSAFAGWRETLAQLFSAEFWRGRETSRAWDEKEVK